MTRILNSRDDLLPIGTEFERTDTTGLHTSGPVVHRRTHYRVIEHRLGQVTRNGDVCEWVAVSEPLWMVENEADEVAAMGIELVT